MIDCVYSLYIVIDERERLLFFELL